MLALVHAWRHGCMHAWLVRRGVKHAMPFCKCVKVPALSLLPPGPDRTGRAGGLAAGVGALTDDWGGYILTYMKAIHAKYFAV